MASGYISEYSDKLCHSYFLHPASFLIGKKYVFAVSFVLIVYMLLGVAIATNFLVRGVRQIVSSTEIKTIKVGEDPVGLEKSVWNQTVTNLTLYALVSYAPAMLLHLIDVIIKVEKQPVSPLGPQVIIGSAAFNILFVTAIAICTASNKVKKIDSHGVWIYTAIVSTLAYVWYFLVLAIISPNEIELWEALVSLLAGGLFLLIGYIIDARLSKKPFFSQDEFKGSEYDIKAAKCTLRQIADCFGEIDVVRAAKGEEPIEMKPSVISDIRECFNLCLNKQGHYD